MALCAFLLLALSSLQQSFIQSRFLCCFHSFSLAHRAGSLFFLSSFFYPFPLQTSCWFHRLMAWQKEMKRNEGQAITWGSIGSEGKGIRKRMNKIGKRDPALRASGISYAKELQRKAKVSKRYSASLSSFATPFFITFSFPSRSNAAPAGLREKAAILFNPFRFISPRRAKG